MHYSLEAEAELISADERRDYSALNAVRLLCSDDSEAISAEGLRGKWTEYMKCQGKTDFIHGVRLKSEPWKGWGKFSSIVKTSGNCKPHSKRSPKIVLCTQFT